MNLREEIIHEFTVSFSTTIIILIAALVLLSYHYSNEYDTIIGKVDEYMCMPPSVIVVKE
jgi:hypothetical protein